MAVVDRPDFDSPIVVVGITDKDYYDPGLFGGTSPLAPDALSRIMQAVFAHRPRGVILDVLIHPSPGESPARVEARERLYKLLREAPDGPVILVRDPAAELLERKDGDPGWSSFDELTTRSNLTWANPSILHTGAYVRAVPQLYEPETGSAEGLPTVLGGAVTAFELKHQRSTPWWVHHQESDPLSPWRIRFSGQFLKTESPITPHHVDAGSLLMGPAVPETRSLLTDRIILVGGTFRAGRDTLPTVIGDMAGVYVWAEAIASWMRQDALREPIEAIAFMLEFLIGVVTGFLLVRFRSFVGLILSFVIVSPLMVISSLLTFGDRVLFVNFLPSYIAVFLHYQLEVHREVHASEHLNSVLSLAVLQLLGTADHAVPQVEAPGSEEDPSPVRPMDQ